MVNMKKRKVKGLQGVSNSSKKKRREDEISEGGKRGPAAAEEAGPELMLKMKKRKENRVDGNSDSSKKKTRKEKRLDGDSDCSKKESRKEKTSEGESKKTGRKRKEALLLKRGKQSTENKFEVKDETVQAISSVNEDRSGGIKSESKKAARGKKKGVLLLKKEKRSAESKTDATKEPVAEISSVDEDCSRGMKKWVMEYRQRRPGLDVIQQRLNEFIASYEAEQEQAKREREARAAGEGWTVVVHHKGRKKTTDSESGVAVGSVSQAAVEEKMTRKKEKELALDFYRFQKREAHRSELMILQSKFEQDKKRVQQLRAARKFRPY